GRGGDAGRHPAPGLLAQALDAAGMGERLARSPRAVRLRQDAAGPGTVLMRRREFLKVASAGAALTVGGVAPRSAHAQGRTLKIGYVSPQTGPLAGFGETDSFVLAGIRKTVSSVTVKGGRSYPVEIIVRDSQSDPNRAAEVASRLILSDKIDLMLVASTPETTNPVSDQCEVNGTPCVSTMCPWQPWFFARGGKPDTGFKSTYHFFWGLE